MFENIQNKKIYKRFINGDWIESEKTIKIYSPINNEFLGEIPAMNSKQVNECIDICNKTQKHWNSLPLFERCNYMIKWADNLFEVKDEIANIMAKEISKDYKSCLSEIVRTCDLIRETVYDAKRLNGEFLNGEATGNETKNKLAIVKRVPIGVVVAISPFNYPINLAASKIAPALIMGNTVAFKPATQGAISSIMLISCLSKTGIPKGIINIITGQGNDIGSSLTSSDKINMINFTGSTNVGKQIATDSGMIPLVMELGGKDSAIVLEDADLEKAADNIIKGAFSYSGQRCTAIKRVLVIDSVYNELTDILKEKLKNITVGNPFDNCTVTPLINEKSADFIQCLIDDAKKKGANIFQTGVRDNNLIYPTLVINANLDMDVSHKEPFGPVLPIIKIKSIKEAIEINNSSPYGLQSSIFSKDVNNILYIANLLDVGTVNVNGKSERGPDNFPFLGVKNSGIGVQGIKYSLEACSTLKSIVINL